MRGLEFGTKVELHGLQCAVATNIVAGLYEKVLTLSPDKNKALDFVSQFDYEKKKAELRTLLGGAAETMIALEQKEQKYSKEKHAKRLNIIIEKWDKICQIIQEEIPTKQEIDTILETIGSPKTVEEIGVCCDLHEVLKATQDIRDKYVLSRLLWDLGVIEEITL